MCVSDFPTVNFDKCVCVLVPFLQLPVINVYVFWCLPTVNFDKCVCVLVPFLESPVINVYVCLCLYYSHL